MQPDVKEYIGALGDWFKVELEDAFNRTNPTMFRLCLGCAVWGNKYIRRFLDYGVPSLLAPGNMPFLLGSGDSVWIVIHTDEASVETLKNDPGLIKLGELGACVEINIIPQAIIDMVPGHFKNKFRLLAAAHNLHMKQAKYMMHNYHMLMPDHVYSENYFLGIKVKHLAGYDAVVHGGLSATIDDISSSLIVKDNVLSVNSKTLNGMAWKNLHAMFTPYVMNDRDLETDCPVCSHMIFSSNKYVHILSPHHSIAYLSHRALMKGPIRLFNTIDSQLPYFISESMKVCIPWPEDDMSYIEISDREKPVGAPPPHDLMMFCMQFWISNYCESGFLRFFDMDNLLALPEGFEHPIPPMTENEIGLIKDKVRKTVRKNRELCMKFIKPVHKTDPIKDRAA